jgi:CBS domain containing-hemolysin-like protein
MEIMPYLGIAALVLMSAFFSGSEIAFASVNRSRLRRAHELGNKKAGIALYIADNFGNALSTILIGNNLVNIAASSVATLIALRLLGEAGTIVSTAIMTVLILTFGEITPKILAKQHNYKFVLLSSYPLRILMLILTPLIKVILWIVNTISKIWDGEGVQEPSVTEEELVMIIESVEDSGIIDEDQSDLLQSALEFADISVDEIFTHRMDMVAIDIEDDMEEVIQTALDAPFSRLPVYRGSIDNIIGVLHLGRFFKKLVDKEEIEIDKELIDVCFVHKAMKLPAIFAELKRRRLQLAIVTDEYGGTMGCITMEDILEQLVGDIWDESDEIFNEFLVLDENHFEVSGDLSIRDFFEHLDLDDRDFESNYSSVGGWVIEEFDGLPEVGDKFNYENIVFEVKETEGQRVTRLNIEVLPIQ